MRRTRVQHFSMIQHRRLREGGGVTSVRAGTVCHTRSGNSLTNIAEYLLGNELLNIQCRGRILVLPAKFGPAI
jgi:hypothetical protein